MTMDAETAVAQPAAPTHDAAPSTSGGGGGGGGLAASARSSFEPFGSGQSLPSSVTSQLSSAYGTDLGSMRVHNDSAAHQAADGMGAEAFTHGNDVYFGSGGYQPGTEHGDYVIAHEAAHVAQGGGGVHPHLNDEVAQGRAELGAESDSAESDASAGADAVASGGTHSVQRGGPSKIRRFSAASHANHTERALSHMGLSAEANEYGNSEVRTARSGNWERDLSQVVIPTTRDLHVLDPIMSILNILSMKDFGRPINLQEFGGYDPVEHIDNPADLRANGAFAQGGFPGTNLDADQNQHETAGGQVPVDTAADAARGNTGWAGQLPDGSDVDPRYRETYNRLGGDAGMAIRDSSSVAFSVDTSGIPVYMSTSKELLRQQMKNCMRLGRRGNDGRGPRLFSSAVHILQDYYAHSNFSEIAINILLREGAVDIVGADGQHQQYDYRQHGSRVLNTQIHGLGTDGTSVADENLTIAGRDGRQREVMTTGTFNLIDTAASVLEEVKDMWMQINPFEQNNPEASRFVGAALDLMQLQVPEVNTIGTFVTPLINDAINWMGTLAPTAAAVVSTAATGVAAVTRGAGHVASAGLGFLNWANSGLGGSDNYFGAEQAAVTSATGQAATSVEQGGADLANAVRGIGTQLQAVNMSFDGQHGLRNAQMWISANVRPIEMIANAARPIPVYGDRIAAYILTLGNNIKARLEAKLGEWWNRVITWGVTQFNNVIQALRRNTAMDNQRRSGEQGQALGGVRRALGGVGDMYQDPVTGQHMAQPRQGTGIAPTAYSPPSHTEIAKDHPDHTQGARDGHADHAGDPASRQQTHEQEDHDEHPDGHGDREGGHDHLHGEDQHGHVHLGAWLSPIAEGMSMAATRSIGDVVNTGWNNVDAAAVSDSNPATTSEEPNPASAGYPNRDAPAAQDTAIDATIDRWFSHPEDCRGTWEGFIRGQLQNARVGGELLRRLSQDLSAARPGSPTRPEDMGADAQIASAQRTDSPLMGGNRPRRTGQPSDGPDVHAGPTVDYYGEGSTTAHGQDRDAHEGHRHGHAGHGHDGHVCAPGCGSHPGHGQAAHVCTNQCGSHSAHGTDEHQCGPGCGDHAPHGGDTHSCGPGCGDFRPHGADAHQCTEHCERHAA